MSRPASRLRRARPVAFLVLLGLLAGCGGGDAAIRYYVIDPVPAAALVTGHSGPAVEILDLTIPQYLERFNIATRRGENRLVFSETRQWGGNLRKNLMRTMARNLSALLASADISTPLNRSASRPDYRLQVNIEQFERGTDGRIRLAARWQISDGDGRALAMHSADLRGDDVTVVGDYDAIVADMQRQYGQLCHAVAESILVLQKP